MNDSKWMPVVTADARPTESFRLPNLFYPALFGGSTALAVVAVQNAKMLRMPRREIRLMLCWFAIVLVLKGVFVYSLLQGNSTVPENAVSLLFKLPDFMMFVVVYLIQSKRYRIHMVLHERFELMGGVSVRACLISWVANAAWWIAVHEWL